MTQADDVKIGLATIWAIGVGSALGGDFFGWQFVLYGGFVSAFIAVVFTALFYWLYAAAITELAARYKSNGGSFDFVRNALGRKAAALMAILGLLKLILANSANALAISSYLSQAGLPTNMKAIFWVATYGTFTVLDCIGVKQSALAQVLATALCVGILLFFDLSTVTKFSMTNIKSEGFIFGGLNGFMKGFPFALQFFDGFEEVPLLMGYAHNPEKNIPRAILYCYVTIALIAILLLVCGSGATDAATLLVSEAPLMNGFDFVYGAGTFLTDSIAYLIVLGLIVNFFAFVVFASQQVQAVAEGGQLPSFLAYRHPVSGAPINASVFASIIGVLLTIGFSIIFGEDSAQNILVTAALVPAVLGYCLLLECIVKIREVEEIKATSSISRRDSIRLGYQPGALRFKFDSIGARIAQAMCLFFLLGLIVLAFNAIDYMYGFIVLIVLATVTFIGMHSYIPTSPDPQFFALATQDDMECLKEADERPLNPGTMAQITTKPI